jgi:hypothetical protein
MSNLSEMLNLVESAFENERKRSVESATKIQEDQAVLQQMTKEQWEILHSELEAKAKLTGGPNIHHGKGMIQVGSDSRMDLLVTGGGREVEKLKAVFSSVSRNFPTMEIVLVPAILNGHFQWTTEGFDSDDKPGADITDSLFRDLMKFHGMVLRAPQRSY